MNRDPNTHANVADVATQHIALDWNVDFASETISGAVVISMHTLRDNVDKVVLDLRDIAVSDAQVNGATAKFELGAKGEFGQPLTIAVPVIAQANTKFTVRVAYRTSPTATATQWLKPSQTVGKVLVLLFLKI